jgi:hypothetical protein
MGIQQRTLEMLAQSQAPQEPVESDESYEASEALLRLREGKSEHSE